MRRSDRIRTHMYIGEVAYRRVAEVSSFP